MKTLLRRLAGLALVLVLGSVPTRSAEADRGARLEQFKLKVKEVNTRIQHSYKTAEVLVDLREELFAAQNPQQQLRALFAYLEARKQSILETREILAGLDAAIVQAEGMELVDRPDKEAVVGSYFEDCEALFHDLDLIEAEAREIAPDAADATNVYLVAVQEVRKSMQAAAEQLQRNKQIKDQGMKKEELLRALEAIRVGLATRQKLQLFDYKSTAAATKIQSIKNEYQALHEEAFKGLSGTRYMEDLAYSGDEIAGWTDALAQLLQVTPIASLDPQNEDWQQAIEAINRRPKPFVGPGGRRYRYDRRKDRYYTFVIGRFRREWAPSDYTTRTGKYVKYSVQDGAWYSHHPAYGGTPHHVFPDEEME